MSERISTLIVDDEDVARNTFVAFAQDDPDLWVQAMIRLQQDNVPSTEIQRRTIDEIVRVKPQLLFLDKGSCVDLQEIVDALRQNVKRALLAIVSGRSLNREQLEELLELNAENIAVVFLDKPEGTKLESVLAVIRSGKQFVREEGAPVDTQTLEVNQGVHVIRADCGSMHHVDPDILSGGRFESADLFGGLVQGRIPKDAISFSFLEGEECQWYRALSIAIRDLASREESDFLLGMYLGFIFNTPSLRVFMKRIARLAPGGREALGAFLHDYSYHFEDLDYRGEILSKLKVLAGCFERRDFMEEIDLESAFESLQGNGHPDLIVDESINGVRMKQPVDWVQNKILNLVANAKKVVTSKDQWVGVRVFVEDGFLSVKVSDNTPELNGAILGAAFERKITSRDRGHKNGSGRFLLDLASEVGQMGGKVVLRQGDLVKDSQLGFVEEESTLSEGAVKEIEIRLPLQA